MIPIHFDYYQPHSIDEAIQLFDQLQAEGKAPLFFNGGTEIITMLRLNTLYTKTKAVIDIKHIPECSFCQLEKDKFIIGASVPLAQLEEMRAFQLLAKNCSRIADHTSRYKITLGGNICGNIKYKEAILPLLLTDSELVIASKTGMKYVPIAQVFDQQMNLQQGEFIVQIHVPKHFLEAPFVSKKQTTIDRIGYPLLTVSALRTENEIRFAFSGLCDFPFRSIAMENILNEQDKPVEARIASAINHLPAPIVNDLHGSAAYRQFVLTYTLAETIAQLEGEQA